MARTFQYGPFNVKVETEKHGSGRFSGRTVTVTNQYGENFTGIWETGSAVAAARMAIQDLARAFQDPRSEPGPGLVEAATMFGEDLVEAATIVGEITEDYKQHHDLSGKKPKPSTVGVDTGNLLVVDPAYLFSQQEWEEEINPRAKAYGNDWPRAVLEVLAERTGRDMPRLATVVDTCGDGVFEVELKDRKIQIKTSCP